MDVPDLTGRRGNWKNKTKLANRKNINTNIIPNRNTTEKKRPNLKGVTPGAARSETELQHLNRGECWSGLHQLKANMLLISFEKAELNIVFQSTLSVLQPSRHQSTQLNPQCIAAFPVKEKLNVSLNA